MGINDAFDDPIYGGGLITTEVPDSGPIAIAGHVFQIEPTKSTRKTLEALRPASDVQTTPGEASFETHGLWSRTQKDWRHGAGQKFFDDADSLDTRFYISKGVDIWTPHQASLLPDTTQLRASTNTNLDLIGPFGAYVLQPDGSTLRWSTDGVNFTGATAAAATIKSVCSDGTNVFVAVGSAIVQKGTLGGGLADFGTFAADMVGYGNGRLIAGKANRLVELSNVGGFGAAGQLDYSHVNAGFVWKGLVATPQALYAWGDAGGVSEVYYITIEPSTGNLRSPVAAWPVPIGETVRRMVWDVSVMLIGTNVGIRLATQNGQNSALSAGAMIEIAGGIDAIACWRSWAWFTWTNFDTGSTGIGRLALNRMVDATNLVPAYAPDLMVTGQGTVGGIAVYQDKRIMAVQGLGVYGQSANLVPSGYIDSGWITFSTIERKVAVSIDLRHDPLVGSVSVAFDLDVDQASGGTRLQLSTSITAGTLGPSSPFTASNYGFERARVITTLNRSASTPSTGPSLRRNTFRAMPTPILTDEIIMVIRLKTAVMTATPNSMPGRVYPDVISEFRYLKAIEASGAIVRLQFGITGEDVKLSGVEQQPDKLCADGSYWESLTAVRMLTVNQAA